MEKFNRWGLLDDRNRPFIEIGIKNFFEEDYNSSIHILVLNLNLHLEDFLLT
jgi:hypothetical protein